MHDGVLRMIEKLVGFPTVSRDSNLGLIEYVQAYLDEHGVASRLVPNDDGTKANLYATVGPASDGGVVLSGHTDVVPVDGQPWSSDPFTVERRGSRLFGRGTSDMKSFSAVGLALVPEMLSAGLKRPIHFALSYDEEVGCVGAPDMIAELARELPGARAVVVGEPTDMQVVNAHKGMAGFETIVTGHEAHSAQTHRGVSAVMTAARLIEHLNQLSIEAAERAPVDSSFEPPFTTVHVGVVNGGTAMNIISRECRFCWDVRCIPSDDISHYTESFRHYSEALLQPMREIAEECAIETRRLFMAPGLAPEPGGAAETLARALTGRNDSQVVSYGTEAGQFQSEGFSTVICGPGSIDQAHQPDEYIECDQVSQCIDFMRRLISLQAEG